MEFEIRTGEKPRSSRQDGASLAFAFEQYLVSCAGHCYTARCLPLMDVCSSAHLR
jgi:hypothetical protein